MSDLTKFRDHCRAMAAADHKPECKWPDRAKAEAHNLTATRFEQMFGEERGWRPRATWCEGCLTDADRALFAQMAGEVDDYLTPHPDLFGDMTTEPIPEPEPVPSGAAVVESGSESA